MADDRTIYDLFFRVPLVENDGTPLPRRSVWRFLGGGVTDNPDDEVTEIDPAAFMGEVPGTNGQLVTSDGEGGFGAPFDPNVKTSADGKVTTSHVLTSFETVNGTQSTAYSFTLLDGAITAVDLEVTAIKSDLANGATYKRAGSWRRNGGTVSIIGAVRDNTTDESSASWDCTLDVSGTTLRVRVTGAAYTIRWGINLQIQTTVP